MNKLRNIKYKIWKYVWRNRLNEDDEIVSIKSWRSAIIDVNGNKRKHVTFCIGPFQ